MEMIDVKFERIRRLFFPRWDVKREWKLQVFEDHNYWETSLQGLCDPETKTIRIPKERDESRDEVLLIHEIAHAVTPGGSHRDAWQRRLKKAADRAKRLGMYELGARLEEESKGRDGEELSYALIEDMLLDRPEASYEEVVRHLTMRFVMSPEDMAKAFPRARQVYERAQRQHEEDKRRSEELKRLLEAQGIECDFT